MSKKNSALRYHKCLSSESKVSSILILMKLVYFGHILEKTGFINFHDSLSKRAEFLYNDRQTDRCDEADNQSKETLKWV